MYLSSADLTIILSLLWILVAAVVFLGVIEYLRLLHETTPIPAPVQPINSHRLVRRRCLIDATGRVALRDGCVYNLRNGIRLEPWTKQWVLINEVQHG